jgi:hypothetical protein
MHKAYRVFGLSIEVCLVHEYRPNPVSHTGQPPAYKAAASTALHTAQQCKVYCRYTIQAASPAADSESGVTHV